MSEPTALTAKLTLEFADDLAYLEHRYAELEEYARTWANVSSEDKNGFLFDWPIVEDQLQAFQKRVEQTGVPAQYQSRHQHLLTRIAPDRPLLARLRQS